VNGFPEGGAPQVWRQAVGLLTAARHFIQTHI
jgi:hypothetical protein